MRVTNNNLKRARQLRKHMSLPEVMLWKVLRGREPGKPVFRRQHPLGPYVLDFYCPAARLCVEIDGAAHGFGERPMADRRRDGFLRDQGIRTLRLNACEVIRDAQGIGLGLLRVAATAAPPPPLRGPPPP